MIFQSQPEGWPGFFRRFSILFYYTSYLRISQQKSSYLRNNVILHKKMVVILLCLDNLFALLSPRGSKKMMSEATGISMGNISDWKTGRSKPSADALSLAADYFNVSVDYLLGRTDEPAVNRKPATVGGLDAEIIGLLASLDQERLQLAIGMLRTIAAKNASTPLSVRGSDLEGA